MPGVPSHGPQCDTRTYPTRCRYCETAVFFFQCSCGSRMLFDDLGEPWPRHDCKLLPWSARSTSPTGEWAGTPPNATSRRR